MNGKRRTYLEWLCLGLVLAGLVLSRGAQAQVQYENQVREQLLGAAMVFLSAGYEFSHEPILRTLDQGARHTIRLQLYRGIPYAAIGVCDHDCYHMDLALYDENGHHVDGDYDRNDTPVVQVVPAWTGTFYLVATVPACRNNPCWFGVGVFSR